MIMDTNNPDAYYSNSYYGSNWNDHEHGAYYLSSNPSYQSFPDLSVPPPNIAPTAGHHSGTAIAPPPTPIASSYEPHSSSVVAHPSEPVASAYIPQTVPYQTPTLTYAFPPPPPPVSENYPPQNPPVPLYDNFNGTALQNTDHYHKYSSNVPPTFAGPPHCYSQSQSGSKNSVCKDQFASQSLKENGYFNDGSYLSSQSNLDRCNFPSSRSSKRRKSLSPEQFYSRRSTSPQRCYRDKRRSKSPQRINRNGRSKSPQRIYRNGKSKSPQRNNREKERSKSPQRSFREKRRSKSPQRLYRDGRSSHQRNNRKKERSKSPQKSYRENSKRLSQDRSFRSSTSSFRGKDSKSYESRKYKRSLSRSKSRSPLISENRNRGSPVRRSYRKSPVPRSTRKASRSPRISPARSLKSASDSEPSQFMFKEKEDKVKLHLPKKDILSINSLFASDEKSESEEEKAKLEEVKAAWVRSAPADLYYQRDEKNPLIMKATPRLTNLITSFEEYLVKRGTKLREEKKLEKEKEKEKVNSSMQDDCSDEKSTSSTSKSAKDSCPSSKSCCSSESKEYDKSFKRCGSNHGNKCSLGHGKEGDKRTKGNSKLKKTRQSKKVCVSDCSSSDSDRGGSSSDSSSSNSDDEEEWALKGVEEMERKKSHPDRLHPELWYNDLGEMNDGPLCRCSLRARRSGIRHGYYAGEEPLERCDLWSNNANKLYHYLVTISPPTNFLVKTPTIITHDSHEFIFEGFSLLSHHPLEEVPTCQVIRFNIEYSIYYIQEKIPENFCIKELNLFYDYLFEEVLELVDLNFKAIGDEEGCSRFHFMPRFVRQLPDNGKEVLSMNEVLNYLIKSSKPLVTEKDLDKLIHYSEHDWLNYTDKIKGMIVTYPGKKPCSIRVDQLDRDQLNEDNLKYPVIVHFGIRPPQLSYAGNPSYQKALREYVKFRHLLANMPKPSFNDKRQLELKENRLQEMRMASKMKRDVTIAISAEGFCRTGIMCDMVQHALLIPVLVRHLRFHRSLNSLEEKINYKFKTKLLLQLALTHPSYRENFGTNPDHARNSLTNCGVRQPQYGDRRIHFMNTHKRGINTLVNIMSRFGKNEESESKITHNERLEFLGDAVVEFLTSIHLFHLFPTLEEGGLATYRAAVVQNQHLSVLADKLSLHQYVLHAHGSDLCHTLELRHAMANCFEALMGAIFIDSNIEAADAVFSATLFQGEPDLHEIWVNYKPHPLQEQEPQGDRRWIKTFAILQDLAKFEDSIGIKFTHIRLLARAFTDRSIGFNYLTLGSNQRLEFLGDTVLQLVASEYLYRFFPEHHEGHLSLLRSSLVNNRTQAVVCDDLQMTKYAMYSNLKTELKTKDRADLLEAFLGALYIDRGLDYCRVFCLVCFFPRLQQFIINQEWNDPKSKLQQCCLTLRTMEGGEPDIPVYKVIECKGPTNTRVYTVAVYFKDKRLAKASGHSIQQAEMNAAKEALLSNKQLFPQLAYQRRVIEKNIKIQGVDPPSESESTKTETDGRNRKDGEKKSDRKQRSSRVDDRKDKGGKRPLGKSDERSRSRKDKDESVRRRSRSVKRSRGIERSRERKSGKREQSKDKEMDKRKDDRKNGVNKRKDRDNSKEKEDNKRRRERSRDTKHDKRSDKKDIDNENVKDVNKNKDYEKESNKRSEDSLTFKKRDCKRDDEKEKQADKKSRDKSGNGEKEANNRIDDKSYKDKEMRKDTSKRRDDKEIEGFKKEGKDSKRDFDEDKEGNKSRDDKKNNEEEKEANNKTDNINRCSLEKEANISSNDLFDEEMANIDREDKIDQNNENERENNLRNDEINFYIDQERDNEEIKRDNPDLDNEKVKDDEIIDRENESESKPNVIS